MPNENPNNWKKTEIVAGIILVVLITTFFVLQKWQNSHKAPPSSEAPKSSEKQQALKMQQELLLKLLSQSGYPVGMPEDLVLNPTIPAQTTITTDPKTGRKITKVEFTVNQPVAAAAAMYGSGLYAKGWTVDKVDGKGGSQQLKVSKAGVKASLLFVPAEVSKSKLITTQTTVDITY